MEKTKILGIIVVTRRGVVTNGVVENRVVYVTHVASAKHLRVVTVIVGIIVRSLVVDPRRL